MALKIATLNVRGLQDKTKRNEIFYWLRQKHYDITLLQETRVGENDVWKWSREWEGEGAYWGVGATNSRGVGVLIRKGLNAKIHDVVKDRDGRMVKLKVEWKEMKFQIVNIYAPNNEKERKNFFQKLKSDVDPKDDEWHLVIGGDYNCVEDSVLDRRNCVSDFDEGKEELGELVAMYGLEDIWRRRHINQRQYTYFKKNTPKASRIDRFYIDQWIDYTVDSCEIRSSIRTDHSIVELNISDSGPERGKGYWKMNAKVLKTDLFRDTFQSFWPKW